MLVYICTGLNETQVNDSGPCNGGVGDTVAACRDGDLIAGWAVGGEVSNAVLLEVLSSTFEWLLLCSWLYYISWAFGIPTCVMVE